MRYLIDTNCCIYLFSAHYPALRRRMSATDAGEIGLSVIVLAELALGARLGKVPGDERLSRLREQMPLLPFEEQDAEAYAALPFRRGRFDRLLAAHAVSRDLALITNNEADFADVPGLPRRELDPTMTRYAILSDIHGNLPALEAVVADARAQGCDAFVNLGDTLSGPLWPVETADYLMARDWPTIAGNHERQVLTLPFDRMGESDIFTRKRLGVREMAWIGNQPATMELTPDIFLCHGIPRSDLIHFLFSVDMSGIHDSSEAEIAERAGDRREPMILCGHSHIPGDRRLGDGRRVVNPGSVGLQAFHDDHPVPYTVEIGDPRARYAIVEGDDVTFRQVDYDFRAAAAKAEREGRPDWGIGLRLGKMEPTR